jgi:3-methyladenine DNA glycosylase AlkD
MPAQTATQQATALVADLQLRLRQAADPGRAGSMQAYMKTDQPFYGIQAGPRRRLFRQAHSAHPLTSRRAWELAVRRLWGGARREDMYQALELVEAYPAYLDGASWPLLEELVKSATHWDTLDWIAAKLVGALVRLDRSFESSLIAWWSSERMWVRRASLLAHLHHKGETNTGLLASTILALADDPDFFIRKAIGWVLREYAKTDPAWVREFVDDHQGRLSPLSQREARKRLDS